MKPPFRADQVGSLLRSAALKDARARREKGEITAEQLKAVEDREIEALIRKQEGVGLTRSPTARTAANPGRPISSRRCLASRRWSAPARSRSRAACSRSSC